MKRVALHAVALLVAYFGTWTAAFVCVFAMMGDQTPWNVYWSYLSMAWTFRAGELPHFIWLFSLAAFVPLAALVVFALWWFGRDRKDDR